jgi:hypothetical protein
MHLHVINHKLVGVLLSEDPPLVLILKIHHDDLVIGSAPAARAILSME